MRIKYFEETDTALLEFGSGQAVETRELSEDILLDLDAEGKVVSITIEHASQQGDLLEVSFHRVTKDANNSRQADSGGSPIPISHQSPGAASL